MAKGRFDHWKCLRSNPGRGRGQRLDLRLQSLSEKGDRIDRASTDLIEWIRLPIGDPMALFEKRFHGIFRPYSLQGQVCRKIEVKQEGHDRFFIDRAQAEVQFVA